jgi:hypothetical protein
MKHICVNAILDFKTPAITVTMELEFYAKFSHNMVHLIIILLVFIYFLFIFHFVFQISVYYLIVKGLRM